MKTATKAAFAAGALIFLASPPTATALVPDDLKGKETPGFTVTVPDLKSCFDTASKITANNGAAFIECKYTDGMAELYRCDDRTPETMFGEPTDRSVNPAQKSGFHCLKIL